MIERRRLVRIGTRRCDRCWSGGEAEALQNPARGIGQRLLKLGDRVDPEDLAPRSQPLCTNIAGLGLHAGVALPARDRQRHERFCRYVARPAIAASRLSALDDGRLLYLLKKRWSDGTTHVVFEPLEFIAKLAALVPAPRVHLVRYHGVLAPGAPGR